MIPIEPLPMSPGYAAWAERYLDVGWCGVVPLPDGQKWPPPKGYTGASAPDPTSTQVAAWSQSGKYRGGNLALRLPPNVIAFDIDNHDGKPAADTISALEGAAGIALPDTWTSTSRDDGSAHWFFRVPELPDGERWPSNLLPFGEGVEVLHRGHRYAVVFPSTNPANDGATYRWFRPDGTPAEVGEVPSPDDLTPLPGAFVDVLTAPTPRNTEKASEADARGFLDRLAARDDYRETMSERMARVVSESVVAFPQSGHDAMVTAQGRILRYAEKGDPGAGVALDLLRAGFIAAVANRYSGRDSRGDGESAAARDFDAAWAGAAREVAGDPTPAHVLSAFAVGGFWHPKTRGGLYAQMGWDTPGQATAEKATDAPAPIFRLMGASDWAKPVPPPQFMVRGILVRDTFGVVAGPKKSLKTHENHALALAVATGQPLYNHAPFSVPRSGRVLYIVGEGGQADIQRKLQRMCRTYGVDPSDVARDPQFPLQVAFGAAPMGDARFTGELKGMLDATQPDLVLIESFYNFHPEGVEAGNLYQRGQAIDAFHKFVRSECEGATSLMTDHYRSTAGKGNDLDMISMAGQAEVADSWITRHPYADADVDAGQFHLRVAYGSRQWGGREYDIDWHLGRFNEDTGSHEGADSDDRITWTIAPSGEGTATDKKGGGARGVSVEVRAREALFSSIMNNPDRVKSWHISTANEMVKMKRENWGGVWAELETTHRITSEKKKLPYGDGTKDRVTEVWSPGPGLRVTDEGGDA
ncbi:bifunctional DNA primase/polymerase [Tsukamurella strandjordii]|uniref:Bifunctional DNA primase/polymerase n=1 Tax=Tsukamurella strandjordii TaxID=147577 RepID=A0AA90S8I0_9ACTN|nr:bifunctional DNA primase/polymerase [Tsukamurella strandjordii]MDP0398915.1 bifunctional DNA primase/polymerase [Tsukamurella strandjordii]